MTDEDDARQGQLYRNRSKRSRRAPSPPLDEPGEVILNETQEAVFAAICRSGWDGLTDEELASALGFSLRRTARARLALSRVWMVKPARATRRTQSGGWSAVWIAATRP